MQMPLSRSLVRSWRRDDEAALARHADNRKIWRNLRDGFPHPYTPEDARRFLDMALGKQPETIFCIEIDGEACGSIGYRLHEDVERFSAEIGYWLGEQHWNQGVMTEVLRAVTVHAMYAHELNRIFATPFEWNKPSFRVLEKAGYTLEARMLCSAFKDGQIIDQLLYAYIRKDCRPLD